jgi:hypothetical protein
MIATSWLNHNLNSFFTFLMDQGPDKPNLPNPSLLRRAGELHASLLQRHLELSGKGILRTEFFG